MAYDPDIEHPRGNRIDNDEHEASAVAKRVTIVDAEGGSVTAPTNVEGGGKVSVGTTAVEATFTGTTKTIIISADPDNAGTLYIGKSNVTSAGANAICFLNAGERFNFNYNDSDNAIYVVASEASQNFWKGALL